MIALVLALFVPVAVQKSTPQKPAKPAKPSATKPAKEPAKPAAEPARVTLEQLAPEQSAIVFATPSLAALERAIAPARGWLGSPPQFVETLTGLALPVSALDATKPLIVAGSVEGDANWTWTIAGSAAANGATMELAPPWRRVDVAGHAVWTQRVEYAPAKATATAAIDPAVDLSIRIDVRAAVPVLKAAQSSINGMLAELQPDEEVGGPYGAAPPLLFSAFLRALENSEKGTLDVLGSEMRWTGVPRPDARFAALAQGAPRDLEPLARCIDADSTSWFVGRASPEAPLAAGVLAVKSWSGLIGSRDALPKFDDEGAVSAFGPALAISRSSRKFHPLDRLTFDATDSTRLASRFDDTLFGAFQAVSSVRSETTSHAWGEIRTARIPIDVRTIALLDPDNPRKSASHLNSRVDTMKKLWGGDEVLRARAIRDGRVVVLLGSVSERDLAQLSEPAPTVVRPDVAAAIAELKEFPSAFASSMDLGAAISAWRMLFEELDAGDPGSMRKLADKSVGAMPKGPFVVTQIGGFGPKSLLLRVRTDFAQLLAPLAAAREKRIRKEEAGRLKETVEHKKIADDFYMLHGAVAAYRDNNERWPADLAALGVADANGLTYLVGDVLPKDPWERPYLYRVEGKSVVVTTLGADGAKGGSGLDTDVEKNMQ